MTTTYKVLDAEGPKLTVKYSDGTRSMTLERIWDGETPIDEFLGGMDPLPPPASTLTVDTSSFVGKTGTAQRPSPPPLVQAAPPPIVHPPGSLASGAPQGMAADEPPPAQPPG
jgi:hypothetical protein